MSRLSAAFFAWIQAAPFYLELHEQAVRGLPPGGGRTWLDVGTGPGLVARLASKHGYDVLGIDRDAEMVASARRQRRGERERYAQGDASALHTQGTFDVVSAASLLSVVADRAHVLDVLWQRVVPGGTLLIVETTALMTPANARVVQAGSGHGWHAALWLWARARNGKTVDVSVFDALAHNADCVGSEHTLLLGGLVAAWRFEKRRSVD